MFLLILCGILLCLALILTIKIYLLKKSINEIGLEFEEHLSSDTNTLISLFQRQAYPKTRKPNQCAAERTAQTAEGILQWQHGVKRRCDKYFP